MANKATKGGSVKKTEENTKLNLPGAGPGRPPGIPNKMTTDLRNVISQALEELGGELKKGGGAVDYLKQVGRKQPAVFLRLVGCLLPKEVKVDVQAGGAFKEFLETVSARVQIGAQRALKDEVEAKAIECKPEEEKETENVDD